MISKDYQQHWNKTYRKPSHKLGWYEDYPEPSLRLIEKCKLHKDARILNVGAGVSKLIPSLVQLGFSNLIVNDISDIAIEELRTLVGPTADRIEWIQDDLTQANALPLISKVDLWHDRAVLHFFTKEKDQQAYFQLVKQLVGPNGYVIIAVFNHQMANMCSGLEVKHYDLKELKMNLEPDFCLLDSFDFTYTMPSNDKREYIYTLFRRNNA